MGLGNWDWWNGVGTNNYQKNELIGSKTTKYPSKRLQLVKKVKTYGFIATTKWLFWDFANTITFGVIKSKPIEEKEAAPLQNINEPTDNKNKKIIKVDEPEEDNDVVNKGYLENGKFTGTFATGDAKTGTVVKGLITDIS